MDDYTREALWMEVSTSISGQHVPRVLDRLIELRGQSKESTDRQRARVRGNRTRCLDLLKENESSVYPARKPNQNADVESFYGKVRDE